VDPTSPGWKAAHRKKASGFSLKSISETAMFSNHATPSPGYSPRPHPLARLLMNDHSAPSLTSPYTTDDVPSVTSPSVSASLSGYADYDSTTDTGAEDALSATSSQFDPGVQQRPRGLRRMLSHESIVSMSNGMDIHTLQARPSQLALRPIGITAAGTNVSAVIAQPTLSSGSMEGKRGSVILRDSIAQNLAMPKARQSGGRVVSGPVGGRGRGEERDTGPGLVRAPSALGKLVSWRPWKGGGSNNDTGGDAVSPETSPSSTPVSVAATPATPAAAIPTLSLSLAARDGTDSSVSAASTPTVSTNFSKSPHASVSSTPTSAAATSAAANAALAAMFRAPGINQPGAVPGFTEYWASQKRKGAPSKVAVDDQAGVQAALREVLEEG
jgi:hypothetical protein